MASSGTVPTSHFTSSMDRAARPSTACAHRWTKVGKTDGSAHRSPSVGQCANQLVNDAVVEARHQRHSQVRDSGSQDAGHMQFVGTCDFVGVLDALGVRVRYGQPASRRLCRASRDASC